jgi:hypothetical protein
MQVMCTGTPFPPNLWPLCLCVSIVMCARQSEPQAAAAVAAGVPWPAYDAIALLTGEKLSPCVRPSYHVIYFLPCDLFAKLAFVKQKQWDCNCI